MVGKECGAMFSRAAPALLLAASLAGCVMPSALSAETTGEKFRQVLASIDARCKSEKIGPYLDPADPEYKQKRRYRDCDVLKVKPFDLNAVLATEEGKFAYSIQLPAPLDKPRVKRSDYGTPKEYFEALCKVEAGDYVFQTAQDVNGIAVLRTPPRPGGYALGSYSEESTDSQGGLSPENILIATPEYGFVERPVRADEVTASAGRRIKRYVRDRSKPVVFPMYGLEFTLQDEVTARFAILWRGTELMNDRENGIVGGDFLLIDRTSSKVLAVRRGFRMSEVDSRLKDRVRHVSYPCPGIVTTDGHELIRKVLHPKTTEGGMK